MELEKLKQLLGLDIEETSKDVPLQFIVDNVEETILNYCNIEELPVGLINTAYRMCIDLYRNESIGEENTPIGNITSVKTGDTTTGFSNVASDFKDSLLKNHKAQLNRYRRLSWT